MYSTSSEIIWHTWTPFVVVKWNILKQEQQLFEYLKNFCKEFFKD
jgi:hypothetical protein